MDYSFSAYWCWGEGLLGYIKELIMQFIVTRNDRDVFAADKCVRHLKIGATCVKVDLEV